MAIRLSAALLALAVLAGLLLALALEDERRVPRRDAVSPADIDRAVDLVRRHDPRRVQVGQARTLSLSERDADLLLLHAARRFGADTQLRLQPGRLILQASVAAPLGRWLNAELVFRQARTAPELESVRIGRLPVPTALAMPLLRAYAQRQGVQADAWLATDWIEQLVVAPGMLALRYRIDPETLPRLRAALVAPADQQRLRAYQQRLTEWTRAEPRDTVTLDALLAPMFALAAQRSAAGGAPAEENRAALLTLALYASQRPLGLLVPAAYQWPNPVPMVVTLRQRQDTALHFLVSAVIAAEDGTPLADAVGLWKELADARRGGSGFSFNDLAADRAGTRFGELAVRDAPGLQQRVASGVGDADLLPEVGDLPENLPEAEFRARFGGVGGAGYLRLAAQIEARLDALPLFR